MFEIITDYVTKIFNKNSFIEQNKTQHYEQVINGSFSTKDTDIDKSLCINGQAILNKNVQVHKSILVNGQLIAHHATLMSGLTVNGSSSIDNTLVKGDAQFCGSLEATSTSFANKIEVFANSAHLDNCSTQQITFKQLPKKNLVQRIKLTKNTIIHGDIIFESGHGEVLCDDTSTIDGQIIGGKLLQKT